MITQLTDRGILGITGTDAEEFLQSVITQDIKSLRKEPLLYSAHLTPQGRMLFDFFIFKHDEIIALDCSQSKLMELAKSLHGYVVGKDVEFHDLSADLNVYAITGNKTQGLPDPRHSEMGNRLYTNRTLETDTTLDDYHNLRISNAIPDAALDGFQNRTLANEFNLDHNEGVSFTKGCYVGQELTARTKHRTEPKKRIFLIDYNGEPVESGTPIMKGKQEAGYIFSQANGQGLALLRTRYLEDELLLSGQPINVHLPAWFKE